MHKYVKFYYNRETSSGKYVYIKMAKIIEISSYTYTYYIFQNLAFFQA